MRDAMRAKRRELEQRFLRARLERCERGVPTSTAWVAGGQDFIQREVRAAGLRARQQHSAAASGLQQRQQQGPLAR
jgi:hypothetical protein